MTTMTSQEDAASLAAKEVKNTRYNLLHIAVLDSSFLVLIVHIRSA